MKRLQPSGPEMEQPAKIVILLMMLTRKKHRNTHSQRNSSDILRLNFFAASSLHSSQGLKFCQKQLTKVYQSRYENALDTILDTSLELLENGKRWHLVSNHTSAV